MTIKAKSGGSWLTILLIVAAVAIWLYDQKKSLDPPGKPASSRTEKSTPPQPKSKPSPTTSARGPEKIGGYEVYRSCTLAESRNNDGDSFMVSLPDGRKTELRLYFVDTPESAFKTYRGGETNRHRIDEQAAEMGGISAQQAVGIGQDAKHFTLALLDSGPFDIYTRWDSPYHDERYHAFVEVTRDGKRRWLHELLVERGYVRIHTKGADLPDGTTYAKHKARLRDLESAAKKAGAGVWGLR